MREADANTVENKALMGFEFKRPFTDHSYGNTLPEPSGRMYDQGVLLGYQWAMSNTSEEDRCSMRPGVEGCFIHLDIDEFDSAFPAAGRLGVAGYVAEYMEPCREGDEQLRLEFWESVLGFSEGTDEFSAAMTSAELLRGFVNGVFARVYR